MSYTVLARKYRPETFKDLVGQEWVSRTLCNAIIKGRIAHAFLFSGPRGVGKTSMARILSKALNCSDGPTAEPCLKCSHCLSITQGNEVDVIEIDAASNRGIDHIRALRENVRYSPASGRFKIYIIDEVHMLTMESFNALLKTLEEPPEHVKFIFATTEPQKMPETVRSRCQCYDFRRITDDEIVNRLKTIAQKEEIQCEEGVLQRISILSRGGLRDAESLLDQIASHGEGQVSFESLNALTGRLAPNEMGDLIDAVIAGRTAEILDFIDRVFSAGTQGEDLLKDIIDYWRGLLLASAGAKKGVSQILPGLEERCAEQVKKTSLDKILVCLQIALDSLLKGRWFDDERVITEMALLKMTRLSQTLDISKALQSLAGGQSLDLNVKKKDSVNPGPVHSVNKKTAPSFGENQVHTHVASPSPKPHKSELQENHADAFAKILNEIEKSSKTMATYLKRARLLSFHDNTFEFAINHDDKWGPYDPEGEKVKKRLSEAARVVFNDTFSFVFKRTGKREQVEIPPIVKKTMDLFDGDMI